jgi:hypothetical protein
LTEDKKTYGLFYAEQCYGPQSYHSVNALAEVFGERVISQRLWPACSPDLSACDFYL